MVADGEFEALNLMYLVGELNAAQAAAVNELVQAYGYDWQLGDVTPKGVIAATNEELKELIDDCKLESLNILYLIGGLTDDQVSYVNDLAEDCGYEWNLGKEPPKGTPDNPYHDDTVLLLLCASGHYTKLNNIYNAGEMTADQVKMLRGDGEVVFGWVPGQTGTGRNYLRELYEAGTYTEEEAEIFDFLLSGYGVSWR